MKSAKMVNPLLPLQLCLILVLAALTSPIPTTTPLAFAARASLRLPIENTPFPILILDISESHIDTILKSEKTLTLELFSPQNVTLELAGGPLFTSPVHVQ
jgi:hypothetical protein